MSKITLTPNEFANMVVIYLFNKFVKNKDYLSDYKEFDSLMDEMGSRGGSTLTMKFYLDLDSEQRLKFKRIQKAVFGETSEMATLVVMPVSPDKTIKKKKVGIIKKLKNKLLKKEELDMEEVKLIIEGLENYEEE